MKEPIPLETPHSDPSPRSAPDIPNEFSALMQQVREGSPTASRELVAHYGTHVLRVVRRKLHKSLRSKFDSQDFVQAVWASFFAFEPERYRFSRPDELVAFLAEMARNKVVEAVRQRLQSQKFNVNRERSLESTVSPSDNFAAMQPTPEEIAIAREEWQLLLENQPAHYRQILEMLRGGHGRQEVARDLGLSEKTVRRVVRRLAARPANDVQ